jgi:hypothetical protein
VEPVMGWITVAVIVGSLLAVCVILIRRAALRWWEYFVALGLTVALIRPVYATATGDISEWLPAGFWSDGFDGKDQIIIASVASTVLIPLVIALAVVCAAQHTIACLRASRIG